MVKSKKVDNPIREFVVTLVTFFADVFTKPQREKLLSRSLGPIAGVFGFLSVLTLIYIILDSTEDESESVPESRIRAKNSMIYLSFIATSSVVVGLVFAIVFHKNVPLIRYSPIK